jgi:hypothetical protein
MTWPAGTKVECVNGHDNDRLREGSVYTVAGCGGGRLPEPSVFLVETRHLSGCPFWSRRFRPIVSRKTSIEIFTAMLTGQKTGADA